MVRICLQCRRPGFDPLAGKTPWRREWQPTLVFLPGEFHGQRSLVGSSPCGHTELDMTERLSLFLSLWVCFCFVSSFVSFIFRFHKQGMSWASPQWLSGKESACNAGNPGSIPGLGRSGGGHGNPLKYSFLENPMDRGAWQVAVHGFSKSWTWLKRLSSSSSTRIDLRPYVER